MNSASVSRQQLDHLESLVSEAVVRVLRDRTADPLVHISLHRCWWTTYQNPATGYIVDVLNIQVTSNAPALVRGNFTNLDAAGFVGFNILYLKGYLDHLLENEGPDVSEQIDVHVDVLPDSIGTSPTHPRYLTLDEAQDAELIAPDSPLMHYCRKYGLPLVSLYGPGLVGPTTEMIAALETIWPRLAPKSVLDLFSGTGALADVCRQLGADQVLSLDVSPPANDSVDIFSFDTPGWFDLAILDQFVEHTSAVAQRLIPSLGRSCHHILWNTGHSGYEESVMVLLSTLAPAWTLSLRLVINDSHIVLLTSRDQL